MFKLIPSKSSIAIRELASKMSKEEIDIAIKENNERLNQMTAKNILDIIKSDVKKKSLQLIRVGSFRIRELCINGYRFLSVEDIDLLYEIDFREMFTKHKYYSDTNYLELTSDCEFNGTWVDVYDFSLRIAEVSILFKHHIDYVYGIEVSDTEPFITLIDKKVFGVDLCNEMYSNISFVLWVRRTSFLKSDVDKDKKPKYVYLMKDSTTGFYKIGYSKDPKYRERTLQSQKPTIVLLRTWQGTMQQEKHLHKVFKSKRIRGEWFDLNENDISKIDQYFQKNKVVYLN